MPILALGCATVGSLHRGTGSYFEVKDKSFEAIWKASIKVVSRSLTIVESDKHSGTIKAEKGAGIATWGEVVGVFISPPDKSAKEFTVEVTSLKRSKLQITGQDWKRTILEGIKAELGI